ncbi:RNA-directed DNA polymerase, eukaryota, reverse transcriptase zinc-binding domain protein [Tanacetum coccineum]
MEMMNEFPTIAESLSRSENVSDSENDNNTPVRNVNVNDYNSTPDRKEIDNGSNKHVNASNRIKNNNNKLGENTLDKEGAKLKTYVTIICENMVNNKLKLIPTGVNDGREVVMFDDEILKEGIKKWQLTLCGHFVGYRMSYAELRYNLGRMWGRYGLIDIATQNDMFLFKFRDEEGLNFILESGPWMVNNKPLFIQKWNTGVIMDKKEPKTLPLWFKLYFVPIEAWTVNGIRAIASSLGKPLIMDKTTTRMCSEGRGRVGYARVLVEVQADKEFKDKIKICYKSSKNQCGFSKFVEVEYSWKPPRCSVCNVFGHHDNKCGQVHRNYNDEIDGKTQKSNGFEPVGKPFGRPRQNRLDGKRGQTKEGFKGAQGNNNVRGVRNNNKQAKFEFRPVKRVTSKDPSNEDGIRSKISSGNNERDESISPKASWKIIDDDIKELKKNANKYSVLEELCDTELSENHIPTATEIIDKYVKCQRQPSLEESKNWTSEMFKYFKEQWEKITRMGIWMKKILNAEIKITAWNVRGMCNKETQKEVKKFICDEKLSICATLETHIKPKQIDRISSKVFGRWSWISNMNESHRGCRIIVAWNPKDVSINLLHSSSQSILCLIKTLTSKQGSSDVSFMRLMMEDLNTEDHSKGGSCKSADMIDFQDCIENIEIEDLKSCGMHYTWIKSR